MDNYSNKKRVRDDSENVDANSDELKRARVDSDVSGVAVHQESEFLRVDSFDSDSNSAESVLDSPEVRFLQDNILNILEESEAVADGHGLDSVIRSFEEEIHVPDPAQPAMHVKIDSGESQPELGYLLEASDDELGLPPTETAGPVEEAKIEAVDFERSSSDAVGLEGMMLFEDEIPSYDSFEFGIGAESNGSSGEVEDVEYVPLGGLFDGWDGNYQSGAVSDVSWRTETLPAI